MKHAYVSTACQHDKHDICRHRCKFCTALCLCWCHNEYEALAHAKNQVEVWVRGSRRGRGPHTREIRS